MTPERIEKERSAFEAWHKETFGYLPKKYKDGTFMSPSRADEVNPQDMFEGWLANAAQSEWISVEDKYPADLQEVNILLNTGESSFFYWGTMNPYTTALSIWTSALIVVAIVLLFNFLSLLNQAMTQLFHPDAIKTHIRNDVKARVYSNIKTIFKPH